MPYLVNATGHDPVAGGLAVCRWANGLGYRSGRRDSPANETWEPRVIQAGNYEQHLWGQGRTRGRSTAAFGEIVINIADRQLDHLKRWVFAGYPVEIWRGPRTGSYPADFTRVFAGTIQAVDWTRRQMTLRIRDLQGTIADRLLVEATYQGTNSLPLGVEGTDDIKGQPLPQPYGPVTNASLTMVNTTLLLHQVAARAPRAISIGEVRDSGEPLTQGILRSLAQITAPAGYLTFSVDTGTDVVTTGSAHGYATGDAVTVFTSGGTLPAPLVATAYYYARVLGGSTVTLHTSASGAAANTGKVDISTSGSGTIEISNTQPAQDHWDWYSGDANNRAYVRLGSQPVGTITADITEGAAGERSGAQIMTRMLMDVGVAAPNIIGAAALDSAFPAEMQYWAGQGERAGDALDAIARSGGFWWIGDRLNRIRLGRLKLPGPPYAATWDQSVVLGGDGGFAIQPNEDNGPVWRVTVRGRPNWTIQSEDQIQAATADMKLFARSQYRDVVWPDAANDDGSIRRIAPLAEDVIFETCLTAASDQLSFAQSRFAIYRLGPDVIAVQVPAIALEAVDLGDDSVLLQLPIFDLADGRPTLPIGWAVDLKRNVATVTLWGPPT